MYQPDEFMLCSPVLIVSDQSYFVGQLAWQMAPNTTIPVAAVAKKKKPFRAVEDSKRCVVNKTQRHSCSIHPDPGEYHRVEL